MTEFANMHARFNYESCILVFKYLELIGKKIVRMVLSKFC